MGQAILGRMELLLLAGLVGLGLTSAWASGSYGLGRTDLQAGLWELWRWARRARAWANGAGADRAGFGSGPVEDWAVWVTDWASESGFGAGPGFLQLGF